MAKKQNLPPGISRFDVEQPEMTSSSDDDMRLKETIKEAFLEALREHHSEIRSETQQEGEKREKRIADEEEASPKGLSAAFEYVKNEITGGIFDKEGGGLTATQVGALTTVGTGISSLTDPMTSNLRTAIDVGRQATKASIYTGTSAALTAGSAGQMDTMSKHQLSKWASDIAVALFDGITRKISMMESETVSGLGGQFQELQKAGLLEKLSHTEKSELADIYAAQAKRSVDAQTQAAKYGGAAVGRTLDEREAGYIEVKMRGAQEQKQTDIDQLIKSYKVKKVDDR